MKLLRMTIEGEYKGLSNQTFDFSRSKGGIIALIGLNGSGKSQLLELVCETFALLERAQRNDFRIRSAFPFLIIIEYEILPFQCHEDPNIYRITLDSTLDIFCQSLNKDGDWQTLKLKSVLLPQHIVGYSSGLNENLQRSFMKNAVQYIDTMNTKALWVRKLEAINEFRDSLGKNITTEELERLDDEVDRTYFYYAKKNPGIFKSLDSIEYRISEDSDLGVRPTQLPMMKFLDYDCNSLLVACLGIIDQNEITDIFGEQSPYSRICKFTIKYDLRKCLYDIGAVRDIKQLIEVVGIDNVFGLTKKTPDSVFDKYELDYLSGYIVIDLSEGDVKEKLREAYFNSPLTIFEKLYRIQMLGSKDWISDDKKKLRIDDFFNHVKKPLKTRLPLAIENLQLDNASGQVIDFDDLSDGEAQLLQILAAARIFRDSSTLFILDEPETHFNPFWRSYFHRYLSRALGGDDEKCKKIHTLVSTHSSFMISSLQQNDVIRFEKTENQAVISGVVPIQTYGASFDVLNKQFFGLRSSISQSAVEEIRRRLAENSDADTRIWIEGNLGDSMEKAYLLRKLAD